MELLEISRTALYIIVGTLGLAIFGIVFGLIYKGIDRKITAHMQGRIGPPIKQPFLDVVKLFTKENIIPENAIAWVYNLAPIIGLVGATTILIYLPVIPQETGGFAPLVDFGGDIIVILYLLMIPSIALLVGGFSSGSPYATVGSQREMATMIAYEFPLAIIIISISYRLFVNGNIDVFSLSTIAISAPIWSVVGPLGFIGAIILLLVLVIITPAELSKVPFDAPEAETEIAGGLLVEYSGRNLAMFYLTDGVKTIVMGTIIIALFFPYNLSPVLGLENNIAAISVDILFYLLKLVLVIIFSVSLIRVAIARLKIDQIVYTYWVPLTLMALVGLICLLWDPTTIQNWNWEPVAESLGLV